VRSLDLLRPFVAEFLQGGSVASVNFVVSPASKAV
jgi:hypothetical protein